MTGLPQGPTPTSCTLTRAYDDHHYRRRHYDGRHVHAAAAAAAAGRPCEQAAAPEGRMPHTTVGVVLPYCICRTS